MIEISIVIVTYSAEKFIKNCLDSVFAQDLNNFEVIIIDNNSGDNTINILKKYLSKIILIENKKNEGFCFATNQGILLAKGKYIFTLNSDVYLSKDYVLNLKNFLERNLEAGMAGGKLLRMDKITIDTIGLKLGVFYRFLNIAESEKDTGKYKVPLEIMGPCAAAALYKRELLESIRYKDEFFDNQFFFLADDFDIAWRAQRIGCKGFYVPNAVCWHYRDSSGHKSQFKQYLSFRNRYYLLIKNAGFKTVFLFALGFLFYDFPRLVFLLITNTKYTAKAIAEIFMNMPEILSKRVKKI
ncbi:MAG: glycosyltransferase family 2 protein [Candidatus Omnitrophota bacterium]